VAPGHQTECAINIRRNGDSSNNTPRNTQPEQYEVLVTGERQAVCEWALAVASAEMEKSSGAAPSARAIEAAAQSNGQRTWACCEADDNKPGQ
jgi:hypothetical protein